MSDSKNTKGLHEPKTLICGSSKCEYQWRPRGKFRFCPHCGSTKKPIGNVPRSLNCKRCDHQWIPRLGKPNGCPKCGSCRWNADSLPKPKRGRPDKKLMKEVLLLHEQGLSQRAITRITGAYFARVAEIILNEVSEKNEHPMDKFIELIFSPKYDLIDQNNQLSIIKTSVEKVDSILQKGNPLIHFP